MEDNFTSTVNGAAGYARMIAKAEEISDKDYDVDEADEQYDDDDRCNCSDPGCPCGGYKRGGL